MSIPVEPISLFENISLAFSFMIIKKELLKICIHDCEQSVHANQSKLTGPDKKCTQKIICVISAQNNILMVLTENIPVRQIQ